MSDGIDFIILEINMSAVKTKKGKQQKFSDFLANQIEVSGVPQKEIAAQLEYDKPNIITMFKQGATKVPISKIEPLAKCLGVDPIRMLKMAMKEYMPETLSAIESIMGIMLNKNEQEIIVNLRGIIGNKDVSMKTAESKKTLEAFAKTLS